MSDTLGQEFSDAAAVPGQQTFDFIKPLTLRDFMTYAMCTGQKVGIPSNYMRTAPISTPPRGGIIEPRYVSDQERDMFEMRIQ